MTVTPVVAVAVWMAAAMSAASEPLLSNTTLVGVQPEAHEIVSCSPAARPVVATDCFSESGLRAAAVVASNWSMLWKEKYGSLCGWRSSLPQMPA